MILTAFANEMDVKEKAPSAFPADEATQYIFFALLFEINGYSIFSPVHSVTLGIRAHVPRELVTVQLKLVLEITAHVTQRIL